MNQTIKKSCLAALLMAALFCSVLPAQAALFRDRDGHGEGYTSVLYDNSNGLPTSAANVIMQSPDGFLWIGNYSGLIRYDGNEFYRYPSSSGISSVVSLFCDSRGRIWIGSNDKGVCVMQDENFTFYDREDGLLSSSIRSIVEDPEGNIVIATTSGVAYVDGGDTLHLLDDPQLNREYVCELNLGQDGLIYGVTLSGAFFTLDRLQLKEIYSSDALGSGLVNTVYPDPDNPGWIWLGMDNAQVIHADLSGGMEEQRRFSIAPLGQVNAISKIGELLWLCADNGIGYLDGENRFTRLQDVPMNNSVDHIISDHEGNLWFTSSRQGVMKIVRNRFTDVSARAGLSAMVVNSTCVHDNLLYIAADSGLTVLDANYNSLQLPITELLDGVRIRCIRADSLGRLWFCTNSVNGLVRYEPDSGEWFVFNTDNGLASNKARTILELRDGRFAVATNGGVCIIDGDEIVRTYGSAQGISNLEILCLEEDEDGTLYFGSDGDGIYVAAGDKISRIGRKDGLGAEVILRMKRDAEDPSLLWIITSSSIAFLKDGVITPVNSFPYSNNFEMFFDAHGGVWVLSSNGIYVVKRADMLADDAADYTFYDTKCGLPCAATANSFSQLCDDGTLFISASTGVSSVNINDDPDDGLQVLLAVPYLLADDEYVPVPESGEVRIPARCRRLNIDAYAFTYSLSNPHLSYYLEGFDAEPSVVTKQDMSRITYTNLAGGTYRFRLALLNTTTGAEDQAITVTIVKEKTLYEQLWFRILLFVLAAAAAAGAVWFYFRQKTRALLRKQEEHKQFINEIASVFASCIDMKDAYTNGHSHRVAKYTGMLAERLGKSKEEIEEMYNIALLHDIGKISIPDNILNKPGKLTDEEYQIMRNHSMRGYEILKEVTIDPKLSLGAGYHHERLDGKGYPRGLKGDEIPEIAQIIAVADTFDAMYSTRPYRKRLALDVVAEEIQKSAGTQLSETVVAAFMELVREGAFDNE